MSNVETSNETVRKLVETKKDVQHIFTDIDRLELANRRAHEKIWKALERIDSDIDNTHGKLDYLKWKIATIMAILALIGKMAWDLILDYITK